MARARSPFPTRCRCAPGKPSKPVPSKPVPSKPSLGPRPAQAQDPTKAHSPVAPVSSQSVSSQGKAQSKRASKQASKQVLCVRACACWYVPAVVVVSGLCAYVCASLCEIV